MMSFLKPSVQFGQIKQAASQLILKYLKDRSQCFKQQHNSHSRKHFSVSMREVIQSLLNHFPAACLNIVT